MTRNQLACCCLTASALALTAVLLTTYRGHIDTPAHAGLVSNKDTFTLLTAQTRQDEEALFVLDALSERILIYTLDITKNTIALAGTADLAEMFSTGSSKPGSRSGGHRRSR